MGFIVWGFFSFLLMNIILLSFHFSESGFKIQWVDDTHALGIFSSLSTGSVTRSAAAIQGPAELLGFLCSCTVTLY